MYTIIYQPKAQKALKKMPKTVAQRFLSAFEAIADGESENLDIKPLTGMPHFRLRIGQWRAVYKMDNGEMMIVVIKIGARGDVYK